MKRENMVEIEIWLFRFSPPVHQHKCVWYGKVLRLGTLVRMEEGVQRNVHGCGKQVSREGMLTELSLYIPPVH